MSTVLTPASLGGTPQTMPTNNFWDGIGAVIKEGTNLVNAGAQNYVQVRQAKAAIAAIDVPAQNRPPGTSGLNPQAASVAGGQPQWSIGEAAGSPVLLVALALGLVLVVALVKK